uniref:Uncharacterized protein n=1 Tax=Dicentrarchus labrax TaxID=13489 RepID=A0A8P4G4I4_DICLA
VSLYLKKRKVDAENRQFNNEWTEKYGRHFKTTHNFDATFPPGSAARRQKITGLTSYYEQRSRILFRACTDQERATAASLRVAWILVKKKRPFTDSETVKECMLPSIEEVVTDEKTRKNIIDSIKQIPISDTSNMRRVESLASDVFEMLLDKLRKAEVMSLVVDESTDNSQSDNNVAQLYLCIASSTKASCELKETMDSVMAIINFIRCTSSLQHCLFRKLLTDMSAEYKDLLIHNDISWLSKGNVLKLLCELREEILVFLRSSKLKKAGKFLSLMENDEFNAAVCFLSNIFHHLNQLNMEFQGRDKTVAELVEKRHAFQRKLSLFSADLCPGKMLHFPTLRKSGLQIIEVMSGFIDSLKNNFATRFEDFSISSEVMRFVKDPFWVNVEADFLLRGKELVSSLDKGSLQLELNDIQSSDNLRQSLQQAGFEKFWTHVVSREKFPHSRGLALFLLTMFGSTYTCDEYRLILSDIPTCESSFSHMNAIKTHNRKSLTDQHLQHCLRIALTTYTPDFSALMANVGKLF